LHGASRVWQEQSIWFDNEPENYGTCTESFEPWLHACVMLQASHLVISALMV